MPDNICSRQVAFPLISSPIMCVFIATCILELFLNRYKLASRRAYNYQLRSEFLHRRSIQENGETKWLTEAFLNDPVRGVLLCIATQWRELRKWRKCWKIISAIDIFGLINGLFHSMTRKSPDGYPWCRTLRLWIRISWAVVTSRWTRGLKRGKRHRQSATRSW